MQGGPTNNDKEVRIEILIFLSFDREIFVFNFKGGIIMNSSGWIRAMMAANYDEEKFLKAACDIIGKEFEGEVLILEIAKDNYFVSFDTYSMLIGKEMIGKLKGPVGPYKLDR